MHIAKMSLMFKETGAFAGPHSRVNDTPRGHLRCGDCPPAVYSACLFNLSLREHCNNQAYLPWTFHAINFYNLS